MSYNACAKQNLFFDKRFLLYGIRPTLAPFRLWNMSLRSSTHSITSSRFSIAENALTNVTKMYSHSLYTSRIAGHILGPPENGVYCHVGLIESHRSGRNVSASSPQNALSRCEAYQFVSIRSPSSTSRGLRLLSPPPKGNTVVERHVRTVPELRGVKRCADREKLVS